MPNTHAVPMPSPPPTLVSSPWPSQEPEDIRVQKAVLFSPPLVS